jgi:Arc/MetJ family transcription regulator
MRKTVEIDIDEDLVQEVIRRYGLYGRREAVHLALRALLGRTEDAELDHPEEEYDEFSDPNAWQPHRSNDTG